MGDLYIPEGYSDDFFEGELVVFVDEVQSSPEEISALTLRSGGECRRFVNLGLGDAARIITAFALYEVDVRALHGASANFVAYRWIGATLADYSVTGGGSC